MRAIYRCTADTVKRTTWRTRRIFELENLSSLDSKMKYNYLLGAIYSNRFRNRHDSQIQYCQYSHTVWACKSSVIELVNGEQCSQSTQRIEPIQASKSYQNKLTFLSHVSPNKLRPIYFINIPFNRRKWTQYCEFIYCLVLQLKYIRLLVSHSNCSRILHSGPTSFVLLFLNIWMNNNESRGSRGYLVTIFFNFKLRHWISSLSSLGLASLGLISFIQIERSKNDFHNVYSVVILRFSSRWIRNFWCWSFYLSICIIGYSIIHSVLSCNTLLWLKSFQTRKTNFILN